MTCHLLPEGWKASASQLLLMAVRCLYALASLSLLRLGCVKQPCLAPFHRPRAVSTPSPALLPSCLSPGTIQKGTLT